jgi:DMSO reductase anchor subunit
MKSISPMQFKESFPNAARPVHRVIWGTPAVVNFFLGGTAAGYFILWALFGAPASGPVAVAAHPGWWAVALVAAGFAVVGLEAGRPSRGRYLMAHWSQSWMSRETLFGLAFAIAAVIAAVTASPLASAAAAGAAGLFLLSQAMMPYRCAAVPSWRRIGVPIAMLSSGFASGYALLLLHRIGFLLPPIHTGTGAGLVAITCLAINSAALAVLTARDRTGAGGDGARRPKASKAMALIVAGQVGPALLLLLLRPWSSVGFNFGASAALIVLIAMAVLAGNWAQKKWIMDDEQRICAIELEGR